MSESKTPLTVARWTGAVSPHERGGFVAYGDYLTLERDFAAARAEVERLRDDMADYDRDMLRKFDAGAAESTDLFTWIKCLLAERDRLRAALSAKEPT